MRYDSRFVCDAYESALRASHNRIGVTLIDSDRESV